MALFQIDEEQKLKKALNSGIKRGNLKIIGAILGVLVLIIVFTMVDFGNLFKGQLDLQACGSPTDANYLTCVAEKAQNGTCDDISDAAGGAMIGIEIAKQSMTPEQISKMNQITDTLITKYKEKSCNTGFLAKYSSEELSNYKNFCYPGSFLAYKQTNQQGKVLNVCLPIPDGPFMELLTKKYTDPTEKQQWQDFYTAIFETIYKQSNINLNDLTFLTELRTDPNYKILAYTKTLLDNTIADKFSCKEGPAYVPDPANPAQCILNCDNARSEISKAATSYYMALQQGKPAAEKAGYLKTVSDLMKQAKSKGCYTQKYDEVQKLCTSFNYYQYGLGLSSEENTLLPGITNDLQCCTIPGQTLESGKCELKDIKFQEDLNSSLALYKYALEKNATDLEKTKSASYLKATLDGIEKNKGTLSLQTKLMNKANNCADVSALLNGNKIIDQTMLDALTNISKTLQCCPQPGYYKLVSDPTNGEKPVYSCAVPTEEFKEFQLEQKQCYESPQMSGKIGEVFVMATESILQTTGGSGTDYIAPETISCSDPAYADLEQCNPKGPEKLMCVESVTDAATEVFNGNFYCENYEYKPEEKPEKIACSLIPENTACQERPLTYSEQVTCKKNMEYAPDGAPEYCKTKIMPAPESLSCSGYPDLPECNYKKEPQTSIDCKRYPDLPGCAIPKPSTLTCADNSDIPACKTISGEASSQQVPVQVIKPLYDSLIAKQDNAVDVFLKAVQNLQTTTQNSCKLTELSATQPICTALRNTLSAADYTPTSYSENIKTSLNTLANETLRCCYYENDGNTDLEINFNTNNASTGFACTSKTAKTPNIKSQTIDKTTFNPTALEKLKITYTVDAGATVTISIADITGTEVYKFDDTNVAAQALTSHFWDGKANAGTNTGKIVNNGTYSYSLKAKNSAGESQAVGGAFAVTGSAATQPPVTQPPQVIPQPDVKCTDNQLADNSTKICISGEWVLCTQGGIYDGQKSLDKKLTCAGGKWIDLSNPPPPPPKTEDKDPPCVENNTMMEGKRICKGGEWITCVPNLEGKKSSDGQKECKSGIWQKPGVTPPGTTPPGGNQSSGNIKITKHSAFPVGFNPLINETKITYTISAKAEVEIRILTQSGVTITTLVDNKVLDKGEYFVWWDGTNSASGNGKVVDPATYQYKITAKDPNNGTVKDVKTGNINVVYVKSADFENGSTSPVTVPPVNNQAQATVAMQGATGGKTAGTGPGILIYALFPLGGYFISRYKKR